MNRQDLEAGRVITRDRLATARAMVPSPAREDPEAGRTVSTYEEWMSANELELALDTLAALGRVNECPVAFWQIIAKAAEGMGLGRCYPSGSELQKDGLQS